MFDSVEYCPWCSSADEEAVLCCSIIVNDAKDLLFYIYICVEYVVYDFLDQKCLGNRVPSTCMDWVHNSMYDLLSKMSLNSLYDFFCKNVNTDHRNGCRIIA
jgi:hypothetical protein